MTTFTTADKPNDALFNDLFIKKGVSNDGALTGSGGFENQHSVPQSIFVDGIKTFLTDRLGLAVTDFSFHGLTLPRSFRDALVLGVEAHKSSHVARYNTLVVDFLGQANAEFRVRALDSDSPTPDPLVDAVTFDPLPGKEAEYAALQNKFQAISKAYTDIIRLGHLNPEALGAAAGDIPQIVLNINGLLAKENGWTATDVANHLDAEMVAKVLGFDDLLHLADGGSTGPLNQTFLDLYNYHLGAGAPRPAVLDELGRATFDANGYPQLDSVDDQAEAIARRAVTDSVFDDFKVDSTYGANDIAAAKQAFETPAFDALKIKIINSINDYFPNSGVTGVYSLTSMLDRMTGAETIATVAEARGLVDDALAVIDAIPGNHVDGAATVRTLKATSLLNDLVSKVSGLGDNARFDQFDSSSALKLAELKTVLYQAIDKLSGVPDGAGVDTGRALVSKADVASRYDDPAVLTKLLNSPQDMLTFLDDLRKSPDVDFTTFRTVITALDNIASQFDPTLDVGNSALIEEIRAHKLTLDKMSGLASDDPIRDLGKNGQLINPAADANEVELTSKLKGDFYDNILGEVKALKGAAYAGATKISSFADNPAQLLRDAFDADPQLAAESYTRLIVYLKDNLPSAYLALKQTATDFGQNTLNSNTFNLVFEFIERLSSSPADPAYPGRLPDIDVSGILDSNIIQNGIKGGIAELIVPAIKVSLAGIAYNGTSEQAKFDEILKQEASGLVIGLAAGFVIVGGITAAASIIGLPAWIGTAAIVGVVGVAAYLELEELLQIGADASERLYGGPEDIARLAKDLVEGDFFAGNEDLQSINSAALQTFLLSNSGQAGNNIAIHRVSGTDSNEFNYDGPYQWFFGEGEARIIGDSNDNLISHQGRGFVDAGGGNDLILAKQPDQDAGSGAKLVLEGGTGEDAFITFRNANGAHTTIPDIEIYGGSGKDLILADIISTKIDGGNGLDVLSFSGLGDVTQTVFGDRAATGGLQVDSIVAGVGDAFSFRAVDRANAGITGTFEIESVEKIKLTDLSDFIRLTAPELDAKTTIDLGLSTDGRDLVDYSGLTHGVNYYNGHVSERQGGVDQYGMFSTGSLGEELATVGDAFLREAGGINVFNESLVVKGAEHIVLTDHNDAFIGATPTPNDGAILLEVGGGADKVYFTENVGIADLGFDDRISLFGVINLFGGLRNSSSEDAWAKGLGGLVEYGVNLDGELVINLPWMQDAKMFILNWSDDVVDQGSGGAQLGPGNIVLGEYEVWTGRLLDENRPSGLTQMGVWELFGLVIKTMVGWDAFGGGDPLVFDLDGDGIELTTLNSTSPLFDIDNDLYAERIAFAKGDDGVLARDINGDGVINDASELFGYGTTSGFSVLSALDGNLDGKVDAADNGLADFNGDGVIDANDSYSSLLIWRDLDRDVRSDANELFTLDALGITSISLATSAPVSPDADGGNRISEVSTFTRSDGTTGTVANVIFRANNTRSDYVGDLITVSAAAEALPDLRSSGTVVTLREAMSNRAETLTAVSDALANFSTPDLAVLSEAVRPILRAWAEGSPIRLADGTIVSGPEGLNDYGQVLLMRDSMDDLIDYNWHASEVTVMLNDVTMIETTWKFVSGREFVHLRDVADPAPDLSTFWEFDRDLGFKDELIDDNGVVKILTTYTTDSGTVLSATRDLGDPRTSLGVLSTQDINNRIEESHFYNVDRQITDDIEVHERLIGESLEPFFLEPDNPGAALVAMQTLIETIEQDLELFAVRIAVQNGPLSSHFSSIEYNSAADKFVSSANKQLQDVYASLMTAAGTEAVPIDWLAGWENFLDAVIGDYARGGAFLEASNGFLAQNIIAAYEAVAPAFGFLDSAEALGVPRDIFALGSGQVTGTGQADIFYIDGTDQTLIGQGGIDTYIAGRVIGHNTIDDTEEYGVDARGEDYLRFSYHNASDITAERIGIDLKLTIAATGETILIKNQFDGEWPAPIVGDTSDNTGVNEIIFADGEVWSKTDIAFAVSRVDPTSTVLDGTRDVDVLEGGAGNDTMSGGGDSDVYIVGRGDGVDVINENEDNEFRNGFDVLHFTDGITSGELTFTRDGDAETITIGIAGTTDSVTIVGQFAAAQTGVFGAWWMDRIELFTFDDGTGLNYNDIMDLTLQTYSTSGDDSLYGYDRDDFLDAGAGDDYLSGGDYNDTYVFGRGYGHDTIHDRLNNILSGQHDRVSFTADVAPGDIEFIVSDQRSNDLNIRIRDTNDQLTIVNQNALTPTGAFGIVAFDQIEEFVFTDGSGVVWSAAEMRQKALDTAKTDGDDHIFGFTTGDVLDGGAGNDTLEGFGTGDTYIFRRGYGHDVIKEDAQNLLLSGADIVDFGDILFSEVTVSRAEDHLMFRINDTGETLTVEDQYERWIIGGQWRAVEEFHFADQVISFTDLNPEDIVITGTAGDDTLIGTEYSETFDAKEGNDVLRGRDNPDTYIFGPGYGADVIEESIRVVTWNAPDRVLFTSDVTVNNVEFAKSGGDLVVSIAGHSDTLTILEQYTGLHTQVEEFHFADGTVWSYNDILEWFATDGDDEIIGFNTENDVFGGGLGNDTLQGSFGDDSYLYNLGDGNDVIIDGFFTGSADKVILGVGILPGEVTVTRDAVNLNDVTLTFIDGGSILLVDQLGARSRQFGIEQIVFSDGTIWDPALIAGMVFGSSFTDGDDTIIGTVNDDDLIGGLGNDYLEGGIGDDSYYYTLGDGVDTIYDGYNSGLGDALSFGAGVLASEVTVTRAGPDVNDITLSFIDGGSITIDDQFQGGFHWGLESFLFADGTVWERTDVSSRYLASVSTAGADVIDGFNSENDVIDAGAGNDTVNGYNGDDSLTGGLGDDYLEGGFGNDSFYYDLGDGADTIYDGYNNGLGDTLVLGEGVLASEVTVTRTGADVNDITLNFIDGGSITIDDQFQGGFHWGLESFQFADGTVWGRTDVSSRYLASVSTARADVIDGFNSENDVIDAGAGNDTVNGYNGDDSLTGGLGDDYLEGGFGNDSFYYDLGDGADTIYDGYNNGLGDTLVLGEGVLASEVTVTRTGADVNDITLNFIDGGSITIDDQFQGGFHWGLESFLFADGTVWSRTDLANAYFAPFISSGADTINGFESEGDIIDAGAGNDTIKGYNGNDSLTGGLGDDSLEGGAGNDTYYYNLGDGADTIFDGYYNGTFDSLVLGAGIKVSEVTIERSTVDVDDFILHFIDGGSVLLDEQYHDDGGREYGVERIVFADGTIWTHDNLFYNSGTTPGDDTIVGTMNNDTLSGALGDDSLRGLDGSDTYEFTRGDGHDFIQDDGAGDIDRLVIHGYTPGEVFTSIAVNPTADLILTFVDAGDSIVIANTLHGSEKDVIEQVVFDDGTIWTIDDIHAQLAAPGGTTGNDVISGQGSADIMIGGFGDDTLNGLDGSDTYIFNRGDGIDSIDDNGSHDMDRLVIQGYAPGEVLVARSTANSDDLILTFAGTSDQITLWNTLEDNGHDIIEEILFEDGTAWTMADMRARLVQEAGTNASELIYGFSASNFGGSADTLEGGLGDDTLHGLDGSDTYIFNRGDGVDSIDDNGSHDTDRLTIKGYAPGEVSLARATANSDDLVVTFVGTGDQITVWNTLEDNGFDIIEEIAFDDGTVWTMADVRAQLLAAAATSDNDVISGFSGSGFNGFSDTLEGGLGNDTLHGLDGSDTYVFNRGDGVDSIDDNGSHDTDRLVIKGYAPGEVSLARAVADSDDLVVTFAGTSDQITVWNTLEDNGHDVIEEMAFDDGTVWTMADVRARIIMAEATNGNDVITGFNGANFGGFDDTLEGGLGNDTLRGLNGDDTYIFSRGDGADTIDDDGLNDFDTIVVNNYFSTDAVFYQASGDPNSLMITFQNSDDTILVRNALTGDATASDVIHQITFADGVVMGMDDYRAAAAANGEVSIGAVSAQYLRITLPANGVLSLAEVEIISNGVNIAPLGVAKQSSTNAGGIALRAIDGSTNGDFNAGSVTHTGNQSGDRWWEVDLGAVYSIDAVNIYNRLDGGTPVSNRLSDFDMTLSENPFVETDLQQILARGDVANWHHAGPVGDSASFVFDQNAVVSDPVLPAGGPVSGRYVRVSFEANRTLSLAEVEVISNGQNVALTGTAQQSSTGFGGVASRANDGNTDGNWGAGSVTHTGSNSGVSYWEIDLGAVYAIDQINLFNRTDGGFGVSNRLNNADIFISENAFGSDSYNQILEQPDVSAIELHGNVGLEASLIFNANPNYRGTSLGDTIVAPAGGANIYGFDGADTLESGTGNDVMFGGPGNDTFVFKDSSGQDLIKDFDAPMGDDTVDLSALGIQTFAEVQTMLSDTPDGAKLDFGNGNSILFEDIAVASLQDSDFLFAA